MNALLLGVGIGVGFAPSWLFTRLLWSRRVMVRANRGIGWDVNFWNIHTDPFYWKRLPGK